VKGDKMMGTEKTTLVRNFSAKVSEQINPDEQKFNHIKGTTEQQVLCAFIAAASNPKTPLTAKDFLMLYVQLAQLFFEGIKIDPSLQPKISGSGLEKLIHETRGTYIPLDIDAITATAAFCMELKNEDHFLEELRQEVRDLEVGLLLQNLFSW
jgi:hypothetical protein